MTEGSPIEVVAADDPALLALAQHLRYAVLVGALGREPDGADHARRLVADARDATGATFLAFAGPTPVGAVRINVVADGGCDDLVSEYGLARLGADFAPRTGVVTRLVRRKTADDSAGEPAGSGNSGVLGPLIAALLGVVEKRRLRWIAIRAEAGLVAFYTSMGFTPLPDGAPDAESREVLVFDVDDPRHAEKKTLAGWFYPALFQK